MGDVADDGPRYLKPEEVGRILSVSTKTLRNWRCYGDGPPWIRVGNRVVRYEFSELVEWASARGQDIRDA